MKIKNAYNYPAAGGLECSKFDFEYGYKYESGERVFGIIGEKNVYAEIQRDKENTDWSIMKKYLFDSYTGGDVPGVYGDRSIEVKDLIEGAAFIDSMQKKYDDLPDKVKERYPSLMEFVNGFSEKDFDLFEDSSSSVSSDVVGSEGA